MIKKMPPSRSQFEAFCFMRSNHIQRKRFQNNVDNGVEGDFDDARVSLLRRDENIEEGRIAPSWAGRVEGLNYQISRSVELELWVSYNLII